MFKLSNLIYHIENAFEKAKKSESKITGDIDNSRHFFNNLLDKEDARYLEVRDTGCSFACSAMRGNKANVVCIGLNADCNKGENNALFYKTKDFYQVNPSQLPKFNIYFSNGTYNELAHYWKCLDDIFLFIMDDLKSIGQDSIKKLKLKILYEREENGIYLAILEKSIWFNPLYIPN
jgi:hypothetical protein